MKTKLFLSVLILQLFISTLFLSNSVAQDYTKWSLPEGAKTRFGKGSLTNWDNIAYSPDGTRLAVASRIGIWIYDAQTYQELSLFTGNMFQVSSVTFSPDGETIASIGIDEKTDWNYTIRLWNAETGEHKQTLQGHTAWVSSVAFSPDGQTLASNWDNDSIRLWNAETGEHKQTLQGHTDEVYSVTFSPDGKTLASGSWDGTVLLWRTSSAITTDPQSVDANGKHYTKWGTLKTAEVYQNYPNPFNPETWIPYTLFETGNVKLSIFDTSGELIREFKLGYQTRGPKRIHWDGKNAAGEAVASGIYFYQFEAGRTKSVRKMWLLK